MPRRLVAGLASAILVVVGAALVVGDVARLPVGPPAPARPVRLAFVDASGELATILPDGTDRRSYPAPGLTAEFPAWSPDGTQVAVVAIGETDGAVLVADDRASGLPAPRAILRSSPGPIYAAWAPSGDRLAVLTSASDTLTLQVVPVRSGGPASTIASGQPLYADWIDDAHLLVHSGGDASGAFLGEIGVDASRGPVVASPIGPFQAPAVSPGGRYRAYVAAGSGLPRVVVEARGGAGHHETAVHGPSALAWGPRGDVLAYIDPDQPDLAVGSLWTINPATGATRRILGGLVVAYAWSPDGRTIAAIIVSTPGSTALGGRVDSPPGIRLAATDGASTLAIAFVDVASGAVRSQQPVVLPDLMLNEYLPFFDQYDRSHRLWSPTSDAVVLPLVDDAGISHITIVPADGSAPRQVADGVAAFWSP